MHEILNAIGTFLILIASEFISPARATPLEEINDRDPKYARFMKRYSKMNDLFLDRFKLPETSMGEYFQTTDYDIFEKSLLYLLSAGRDSRLTDNQAELGYKIMGRMWGPNDEDNQKKREALTEELETKLGVKPIFSDYCIDFSILAKGIDPSTTGDGDITLEQVDPLFQNTRFFLKIHGVNIICIDTPQNIRYFYKGF